MARPRKFDEKEILQLAMAEFWRLGFEEVTFRKLSEKTGVGLRSLANTFGDKESLYIRALELYVTMVESNLPRILEKGGARPLQFLFEQLTADYPSDAPRQNGCVIVNQMSQVQFHDDRLEAVIARYLACLEENYSNALELSGVTDGTREKAQILITLFMGAQVEISHRHDTKAAGHVSKHVNELIDHWTGL